MNNEIDLPPSFWSRLGRMFLNLLRFLLILAFIAGIAAAVYFGAPYLYNKLILPVDKNTARLDVVESQQAADMQQLSGQVTDLKSRLTDLETSQTQNAQAMAELQGQMNGLQTAVEAHTETLKQLAVMQAGLDAIQKTTVEHATLLVEENSALADLQRQVTLSRGIEQLSRARLYLSQSNFGLAKQDVRSARDTLAGLQTVIPAEKASALQGVLTRLDLALGNLPAFPVVAVDDVDIAWYILVNGLSITAAQPSVEVEIGSTPSVTPIVESTPTLGTTNTPAAMATIRPTITPTP